MITIRLKRHGKTHFATYRVVVQDAAKHPTSGKVVAYVGNYNPHTKEVNLNKEQIEKYLSNGAQPSPRVVKLLKDAKIKLPSWVKEFRADGQKATRNPDKLRRNRPAEPAEVAETTEAAAEPAVDSAEVAAEETAAEPETAAAQEDSETESKEAAAETTTEAES
jgi:small subunit ribosomal protein S16